MVLERLAAVAAVVFRSRPGLLLECQLREQLGWSETESQSKQELRLRETQHTAGFGASPSS